MACRRRKRHIVVIALECVDLKLECTYYMLWHFSPRIGVSGVPLFNGNDVDALQRFDESAVKPKVIVIQVE